MIEYESGCVGCPREIGCRGRSCPYYEMEVYYCDMCKDEYAKYRIDRNDYCEYCADQYMQNAFDDLSLTEKAELLEIDIGCIGD